MGITHYADRERCYDCYRPKSSCMCGYIKPIQTQTKFIILMHPKEFKKVKNNTGFFTHLSLSNSEVFIGINFSKNKRIDEIIETYDSYILFPSDDALNLSQEGVLQTKISEKPKAIFLIDSTWLCTRKLYTQSTNLNKLPHLSFETTMRSKYEIKEQPQENYLSTIESTLVVLELLNDKGIEKIDKVLLASFLTPFLKMIEYQKEKISGSLTHQARFKKYKNE
jgi:DTW domain-containing protein YfiP